MIASEVREMLSFIDGNPTDTTTTIKWNLTLKTLFYSC